MGTGANDWESAFSGECWARLGPASFDPTRPDAIGPQYLLFWLLFYTNGFSSVHKSCNSRYFKTLHFEIRVNWYHKFRTSHSASNSNFLYYICVSEPLGIKIIPHLIGMLNFLRPSVTLKQFTVKKTI